MRLVLFSAPNVFVSSARMGKPMNRLVFWQSFVTARVFISYPFPVIIITRGSPQMN